MDMKKPIISVRDLVKNYDDFTAVQGISFDVYENEIFGLLGPNGAGKTTTLEIIETLREKTSGEITGRWIFCRQRCTADQTDYWCAAAGGRVLPEPEPGRTNGTFFGIVRGKHQAHGNAGKSKSAG